MTIQPKTDATRTDNDWLELAETAKKQQPLSGFYNENYRLDVDGVPLLFRFRKQDEPLMDPQPMDECDILNFLSTTILPVPKLIYTNPALKFHVQEFIEGMLLEKAYPPGERIPEAMQKNIAYFYAQMAELDISVANILSPDWPREDANPTLFFEKLLETSRAIHSGYQETHGRHYDFLNIPKRHFELFQERAKSLTPRPMRLMHADLHRGNIIVNTDNASLTVIDWELALYGDLLYCIAAHLHRSRYFKSEREILADDIGAALPPAFQKNYIEDLRFYLDYEALKSILTDTVRFPDLVKKKSVSKIEMYELCVYYTDNLNRLAGVLGTKTAKPEKALQWFEEWAI